MLNRFQEFTSSRNFHWSFLHLPGLMLSAVLLSLFSINSHAESSIDVYTFDKHLHVLRVNSRLGNTTSVAMIGEKQTLLIDPNFNKTSDLLKEKLKSLGSNGVTHLSSSHDHLDHIEQYPNFSALASIIVPHQQRKSLEELGVSPQQTFRGEHHLQIGEHPVHLSTLSVEEGHTNGDMLAYFPNQKALYVGDYLFASGYPIIDKHTGNLHGYIKNIESITQNYASDTRIIAGHSTFEPDPIKVFSMEELAVFAQQLKESVVYIERQKNNGTTLEALIEKGLPEQFAHFDEGIKFINEKRWITYVFEQLG